MEENLKNIEEFFKLNFKIKETLARIAPSEIDKYSNETLMKCNDRLYFGIEDIHEMFLKICAVLETEYLTDDINNLFKKIQSNLAKCDYSYNKMVSFYDKNCSYMDLNLTNKVKEEFVAYSMFNTVIGDIVLEANTINELLHIFHSYLLNNEYIYKSMPKLKSTINNYGTDVTLYGLENDISNIVFENFPLDSNGQETEIISLNNKIIIMVRGLGHALSIEIDINNDKCMIRYFIPKVCNPLKVNQLKGVKKVNNNEKFTNGRFECDLKDLTYELNHFIYNVPCDKDLWTYGGWQYDEELNQEENFTRK